jgi:hypothetical protein
MLICLCYEHVKMLKLDAIANFTRLNLHNVLTL